MKHSCAFLLILSTLLCFHSELSGQTTRTVYEGPFEVLITDDGSGNETAQIVGFDDSITNLVIPGIVDDALVVSIGPNAFERSGITHISIPDSVTSISDVAFRSCDDLTEVHIPNSVTWIGSGAFAYCQNLKSINISDGVTSIESHTFASCHNLASINISTNVTKIGEWAFTRCQSLYEIDLPEGLKWIDANAFDTCYNLIRISLPESLISIGDGAFLACANLAEITLPENVMWIGGSAFGGCLNLTRIEIPEGVTSIEPFTFYHAALAEVHIPSTVTYINRGAFPESLERIWFHSTDPVPHATDYVPWGTNPIVYYPEGSTGWGEIYPNSSTLPYFQWRNDYTIGEYGGIYVDRVDWLGYLEVTNDPWLWDAFTGNWIFFDEQVDLSGSKWTFIPNLADNPFKLITVDSSNWAWSGILNTWLYFADPLAGDSGWVYLF